MHSPDPSRTAFSEEERQRVIDVLCDAYAGDQLGMAEFERRVDLANRAGSGRELASLLSDLRTTSPPIPTGERPKEESKNAPAPVERTGPGWELTESRRIPERQFHLAIWSGRVRKGSWVPAKQITAMALMGGVELDFREAVFGPEGVDVTAFAVMGGVEIIIPPGIHVETNGFALMGGFEDVLVGGGAPAPGAPTLRVSGLAVMGGVEITVRQPGESRKEAARRLKEERRKALGEGRRG